MITTSNRIPPIERFWRSVKKTSTCWLWMASKDTNGYGQFNIKGTATLVHRFSYELHKGKIPRHNSYHGICVLHTCDIPNCVNPDHLILGTQIDNIKDRDVKLRMNRKIDRKIADKIRKLYKPRIVSQYQLAKRFGVSRRSE